MSQRNDVDQHDRNTLSEPGCTPSTGSRQEDSHAAGSESAEDPVPTPESVREDLKNLLDNLRVDFDNWNTAVLSIELNVQGMENDLETLRDLAGLLPPDAHDLRRKIDKIFEQWETFDGCAVGNLVWVTRDLEETAREARELFHNSTKPMSLKLV